MQEEGIAEVDPLRSHSPQRKIELCERAHKKIATGETEEEVMIRRLLFKASPPIECNVPSFSSITKLDLPECGLSSLPSSLGTWLPNLSILFCPKNNFRELPEAIGSCPSLQMVSFKNNGMSRIHPDALQPQLRWLILTDNRIEELPPTIGRCQRLQKLMLSGNRLKVLPEEMHDCTKLELVRLASNKVRVPPMSLLQLPNLAWIALSDNPFINDCMNQVCVNNTLPVLQDIVEGELLGRGASGVTHVGTWNSGRAVAVKTYSGSMTSDGNPMQERALALVASKLSSPCLIHVLGQTKEGNLVMELLENFAAFAGPPSMESCTRDIYQGTDSVQASQAISMVSGLLEALVKLHEVGVCHGDFYGHNILVSRDDSTKVRLSDFGAAFPYDRQADYGRIVERIEMRAFAHLVEEIARLLNDPDDKASGSSVQIALSELMRACRQDGSSFPTTLDLWQAKLSAMGRPS